jgi:hypothetical protein
MIKEIVIVSLVTTSLLFLVAYSFMARKSSKLVKEISVLYIDNLALKKFIDNEIDNKLTSQDIHNENFVKFLSDSRDSAFEYIEQVQSTIKEFVDVVEPEMLYFDKYGIVGSAYPHYDSMKKISESYKKLKIVLPEDYGKI